MSPPTVLFLSWLYSYVLSLLDLLASYLSAYKRYQNPKRRFFNKGFGDLKVLQEVEDRARQHGADGFDDIETIEWEEAKVNKGLRMQRGTFTSPLADCFHGANKIGHVVHVSHSDYRLPSEAEDNRPLIKGMMVHLAATGDMGTGFRTKLMAGPMAKQGFASLLLIIPFYGKRKPEDQVAHYVDNVSDYLLSSIGCYLEAPKLLKWHRTLYPGVPLGVTGMSFGGAMASITATLMDMDDLVLVSGVGSASPRVLLSGVLKHDINAQALAQDASLSPEAALDKLREILEAIDLQHELNTSPRPLRPASKVLVTRCISARHDGYVIPSEGQLLFDVNASQSTDASMHWVLGGHGTAIFGAEKHFVPWVVEGFETLNRRVATREDA
eukprot:m.62209 g.62209  ORF g.62209 m.62209 type:complete len:383 (-) comp13922_c0_seq2:42-1190(-)